MKSVKKMTPKQKKFCDEYIKTGNATQSAIKAGYSKSSARVVGAQNLTKPIVRDYIKQAMDKIADDTIMGAQEALQFLTAVARGTEREEVVISGIDGVETVTKAPDIKTRITAARELMKRYPSNDRLTEAQIRKLEADAQMAEYNVATTIGSVDEDGKVTIIDDMGASDEQDSPTIESD